MLSISSSQILLLKTQLLVTTPFTSNHEAYSSPGNGEFTATGSLKTHITMPMMFA